MNEELNLYVGWFFYNLICILLFCFILFRLKTKQPKQLIYLTILVCLLIAVFGNAITMDYRAYWKIIQQIVYGSRKHIHLEEIYKWYISQIGANYILWQMAIYVPAYLVFYYIIKYLNIKRIKLFLFLFVILILYYDCIGSRQFLFIIFYYSSLLFIANRKFLLGMVVLCASFYLHKMALMALPLAFLFLIPLKNKLILFVLIVIILTIGCRIILVSYIEEIAQIAKISGSDGYLSTEGEADSTGSIWWEIIGTYTLYTRLVLLTICLYKTREIVKSGTTINKLIYAIVFWTTLLSLFFKYVGLANGTISYRLLSIGAIGFCYLFTLVPEYSRIRNWQKIVFVIMMLIYFVLTNAYITGVSHSVMLGELPLE